MWVTTDPLEEVVCILEKMIPLSLWHFVQLQGNSMSASEETLTGIAESARTGVLTIEQESQPEQEC